jgi:hypothetical protein
MKKSTLVSFFFHPPSEWHVSLLCYVSFALTRQIHLGMVVINLSTNEKGHNQQESTCQALGMNF